MARTAHGRQIHLPHEHRSDTTQGRPLDRGDRCEGAFLSAFYLDLLDDPNAPFTATRMGGRSGRIALAEHFTRLHDAGVDHLAINLRQGDRPVDEVMHELAAEVVPVLDTRVSAQPNSSLG